MRWDRHTATVARAIDEPALSYRIQWLLTGLFGRLGPGSDRRVRRARAVTPLDERDDAPCRPGAGALSQGSRDIKNLEHEVLHRNSSALVLTGRHHRALRGFGVPKKRRRDEPAAASRRGAAGGRRGVRDALPDAEVSPARWRADARCRTRGRVLEGIRGL